LPTLHLGQGRGRSHRQEEHTYPERQRLHCDRAAGILCVSSGAVIGQDRTEVRLESREARRRQGSVGERSGCKVAREVSSKRGSVEACKRVCELGLRRARAEARG
jgi:hypothetical protein